ncbi:unnamed protein product [Clavelina lepadiformis]|uniref:Uncharacterized protein n=1 Tax=Clavelina lepadiformis TaxID=159417 RepID=A0ABP0GHP8_CLALP
MTFCQFSTAKGCESYKFHFSYGDQTDDYVRYRSYVPRMHKAGTVCAWVYPTRLSDYNPIVSYSYHSEDNELLVGITSYRNVNLWIAHDVISFASLISTNTWTHICV